MAEDRRRRRPGHPRRLPEVSVSLRHALDRLYGAAAWAAALFMIGTLA
jgi:hypothetical protein